MRAGFSCAAEFETRAWPLLFLDHIQISTPASHCASLRRRRNQRDPVTVPVCALAPFWRRLGRDVCSLAAFGAGGSAGRCAWSRALRGSWYRCWRGERIWLVEF
jgi:hypothetical protein